MNAFRNVLIVALAAVAIAASVLAWQQQAELRTARAKASDPAGNLALQKRLTAALNNVSELEHQLAEARQPATTSAPAGGPGARRAGASGGSPAEMLPMLAGFMDRPEMQRMLASQQRLSLARQYAALCKKLGLGSEQQAQFVDLLLDKQLVGMDAMIASAQQGTDPLEAQKTVAAMQAEDEAKIKALLGDAAYAQYREYVRTEPQRAVVGQLQQNLTFNDTPLTRPQAEAMVQILAETSSARPTTAEASVAIGSGGGAARTGRGVITDDAIARAGGILTSSQVLVLVDLQQQQQQQAAEIRRSLPAMQSIFGTGAAGAGTAVSGASSLTTTSAPEPAQGPGK
jgi:hypothetical protein